jgi:hypothetical protein
MKKLVTIVTATVLLLSTSAFASDANNVNEKIKTAFSKNFSRASDVKWEKKEDFYFASFTVNNIQTEAAYNEDGELVAMSRKIELVQLPLALSLALNEKYPGYIFANNATETTYERQTNYYLTIANSRQVLKIKGTANGDIEVESKTKK